MANLQRRLEVLKNEHTKQHKVVEALVAEKAPEKHIKAAKVKKLHIKDQIAEIEMQSSASS